MARILRAELRLFVDEEWELDEDERKALIARLAPTTIAGRGLVLGTMEVVALRCEPHEDHYVVIFDYAADTIDANEVECGPS